VKHCQLSSVASLSHWACTCTFTAMQRVAWVCQRQLIVVIMSLIAMQNACSGLVRYSHHIGNK